ncbi:MAG: nucleoside-diphosphate kinase [Treponema sp.]|jgi:nucleoside diphosphate kinase|nr:nucleoside-diphosphate kinase [Treponema sp.]
MSKTLSYVLVTPYTIAKSRTGGVLSRLLSRTDLELVGAQMFAPDVEFAEKYSQSLRDRAPQHQLVLLADYVKRHFVPSGGRPHRTLLLLFRGENPCEQLLNACGHLYTQHVEVDALAGETIRDTYSDLIFSADNPEEVRYFEPAVLTPRRQDEANNDLRMFADFLEGKENIVQNVVYPDPSKIERTLVIIKPDNWTHNSSRPGTIIDMFSRTGLRVIGIKVHRFSLSEALDFYGPVETMLKEKLAASFGKRAQELLEKEFGFSLSDGMKQLLNNNLGAECAQDQFHRIVEFMSGKRPNGHLVEGPKKLDDVKCMILVYEGENAVNKIRDVLGSTDPLKAREGTVRREFGSSVMVNTAHASDSRESYEREKDIIKIDHNSLVSIIKDHDSLAGRVISKLKSLF